MNQLPKYLLLLWELVNNTRASSDTIAALDGNFYDSNGGSNAATDNDSMWCCEW